MSMTTDFDFDDDANTCRVCSRPIPPTGRRGRPSVYCSERCREAAGHKPPKADPSAIAKAWSVAPKIKLANEWALVDTGGGSFLLMKYGLGWHQFLSLDTLREILPVRYGHMGRRVVEKAIAWAEGRAGGDLKG